MSLAELRPVQTRFRLDQEIMAGPIYRKYEKAARASWDPKDFDYEQDIADWGRMTDAQHAGIAMITVRFEAGEQEVTDELLPMLAAAHALGRFDWVMYISTFIHEEARHSEFFTLWHARVAGLRSRRRRRPIGPCASTPSILSVASRSASLCNEGLPGTASDSEPRLTPGTRPRSRRPSSASQPSTAPGSRGS